MGATVINSERESDIGYKQIFYILLRRRLLIGSIFVGAIVIAALVTRFMEPIYQSRMQLLVEPNYSGKSLQEGQVNPLSAQGEGGFSKSEYDVDYATQLTLLRSSQFIEKAIKLLQSQYPDIKYEDIHQTYNYRK